MGNKQKGGDERNVLLRNRRNAMAYLGDNHSVQHIQIGSYESSKVKRTLGLFPMLLLFTIFHVLSILVKI